MPTKSKSNVPLWVAGWTAAVVLWFGLLAACGRDPLNGSFLILGAVCVGFCFWGGRVGDAAVIAYHAAVACYCVLMGGLAIVELIKYSACQNTIRPGTPDKLVGLARGFEAVAYLLALWGALVILPAGAVSARAARRVIRLRYGAHAPAGG